jgi:hypothetical protein
MRRCGKPLASKRRNAASRGAATSRPPGSRAFSDANAATSAVSAAVLIVQLGHRGFTRSSW